MSTATRALHTSVDKAIKASGVPYLHPDGQSLQLDLLGARHMTEWQEAKAESMFTGDRCWSELPQVYGRYGVTAGGQLIEAVKELEGASGAVLADCGMQACALLADVLLTRDTHAIVMRQVYNKTRRYLEWLAGRVGASLTTVDDGDLEALEAAVEESTVLIFAETFTNPLTRAIDPHAISELVQRLRRDRARRLCMIVDNTIASPWSLKTPLLSHAVIDVVVASGTKALGGQDRDMWGYIASNKIDLLNEVMDLEATRGGILDWRRAQAIFEGLSAAERSHNRRCETANCVASFLVGHPRVGETFHPSLPGHVDARSVREHYRRHGSLLSFRVVGLDEDATRHFADVLATCVVPRYALSFDGLTTKLNHHQTVSEYFTPEEELVRCDFDRLVRLGVGLEDSDDLIACLNWALWHHEEIPPEEVLKWQKKRESELGIYRTGAGDSSNDQIPNPKSQSSPDDQ